MSAAAPRVALVTGAGDGIGAAVAERLRRSGWQVVGFSETADANGLIRCNVRDFVQVSSALEEIRRSLGDPSAVVATAGTCRPRRLEELHAQDWDEALAAHLGGAFNVFRAALPAMLNARSGVLVGLGSPDLPPEPGDGIHHLAARGALMGLTKSLSVEVAPARVRVNCLLPDRPEPELEAMAEAVRFLIEEGTFVTGQVIPAHGSVSQ